MGDELRELPEGPAPGAGDAQSRSECREPDRLRARLCPGRHRRRALGLAGGLLHGGNPRTAARGAVPGPVGPAARRPGPRRCGRRRPSGARGAPSISRTGACPSIARVDASSPAETAATDPRKSRRFTERSSPPSRCARLSIETAHGSMTGPDRSRRVRAGPDRSRQGRPGRSQRTVSGLRVARDVPARVIRMVS